MSTSNTLRSRVSRETRQLLAAALIALLALWVLARIRFPGQPPSPNPIPSLLSQLSASPRFANLAGEIAELQSRLSGSWLAVGVASPDDITDVDPQQLTAMRLRNNAALLLLRDGDRFPNEQDVVAEDRATGLAVIRTHEDSAPAGVPPWMPSSLGDPRYFMATVGTPAGVSLRPVLVGALHETRSPAWPGPIWSVPAGTDLDASAFVFTTSGEIAGLVVREPTGLAIVPWDLVVAEATRLLDQGLVPAIDLRLEVRPLTPALTQATGAAAGVVVAWVDPRGPAGKRVLVGDVIEALNAKPIMHTRDWEVASSRLPAGDATVRVRRRGKSVDVALLLPVPSSTVETASLGLRMQDLAGVGAAVMRVEPGSAASSARLQEGDVITLIGTLTAPTAAQIDSAFRSVRTGEAIMLAITRGRTHLVVGLVK
jgi:S1-C subfamily serine protease